jgi:hypothetical protein
MQIAKCKSQIAIRFAACVFASACFPALVTAFTFDDVDFWVGSGANRAALAIDWHREVGDPPAMVWGYRWDGTAKGSDMLLAIVAADDRLFAKLGMQQDQIRVYGLGYDANDDGEFALDDQGLTQFDDDGIAYGSAPLHGTPALDGGDFYTEGWESDFWHYGVGVGNPFGGGHWLSSPLGIVDRQLADGVWDGWAFQDRDVPPFDAFPTDPTAAPGPYPPGDFNRDTVVDTIDYSLWKSKFGATSEPAVDGNGNGIVDAADYTLWRNNCCTTGAASLEIDAGGSNVPEPTAAVLVLITWLMTCFLRF